MSTPTFTEAIRSAFDNLLREHAKLGAAAADRVAACRDAWPDTPDQGNMHDAECRLCRPLMELTQALGPSPWDSYPKKAFERLAQIEAASAARQEAEHA